MAREYARIMTEIWRNREFRALDQKGQRAYLFLITQPDISAAGLLPMRIRRWSDMSADTTPSDIADALKALDAGRFIVTDFDTEEVLVRAFVRWDGGFTNSKRRPVIIRAAQDVESTRLRRALAQEFERCGLPALGGDVLDPQEEVSGAESPKPCAPPAGHRYAVSDRAYTKSPSHIDAQSHPQVDRASDAVSRFDGVVVTSVSTRTTTLNPQSVPPPAGAVAPAAGLALVPDAEPVTAGHVVAAWAEGFATTGNQPVARLRGQVGKEARELLEAGNDPERVIAAARVLGMKGRATLVTELAIQTAPASALANGTTGRPVQGTSSQRANAFLALRQGNS
jgi:hypothetical protein